jgi:hypothetical protein
MQFYRMLGLQFEGAARPGVGAGEERAERGQACRPTAMKMRCRIK